MVYKLLEEENEPKCPICLEIIAPGDQVHLDALINIIIINFNMANMIVDMITTCPTRWWSLGAPPPSCTLAMLTAWRAGFRGACSCFLSLLLSLLFFDLMFLRFLSLLVLLLVMFGVLFFFSFRH